MEHVKLFKLDDVILLFDIYGGPIIGYELTI